MLRPYKTALQLGEGVGREWGVLGELGRNEPGECPQLTSGRGILGCAKEQLSSGD